MSTGQTGRKTSMSKRVARSSRATAASLVATAALLAFGSAAQGAQAASCSPSTQSYADPLGDAPALAPDASGTTVSLATDCTLTFAYSIPGESTLISGDFLSWFIDADDNPATGLTAGYKGADYALALSADRTASLSPIVNGQPTTGKTIAFVAPFGVSLALSDLGIAPGATFTFAGSTSYKGASGTNYTDYVPDITAAPLSFSVPAAPVATPAPAPAPTPVADCVVPNLKGLTLTAATKRLKAAHCALGKVKTVRSKGSPGVVSSSPGKGKKLAGGAKVALKVRKAKSTRSAPLQIAVGDAAAAR